MPEMKDLIAIFKAETEEHLTKLDNGLVELEKQPDNMELVRSLNREVHTLKGAARVFGFNDIQDIAHRIEDLFEAVAGKRAVFNSSMAEGIFQGLDAIRAILEKIVQEKKIDAGGCRCLGSLQGAGSVHFRGAGRPNTEEKSERTEEGRKRPLKPSEWRQRNDRRRTGGENDGQIVVPRASRCPSSAARGGIHPRAAEPGG